MGGAQGPYLVQGIVMYNLTIRGVRRIEKGILLGRDMVSKEDNNESEAEHYGASALRLLAVGLLLNLKQP